nr:MAG TPA: Protein involved in gliding motility 9 Secretion System Type.5A [Caudoviricetes sp.]
MKKVLLLTILAMSFVSCSDGLESTAKKQIKRTMLEWQRIQNP